MRAQRSPVPLFFFLILFVIRASGMVYPQALGWFKQNQSFVGSNVADIHRFDALNAVAVGEKGVFRTNNGGQSWNSSMGDKPLYLRSVHFVNSTKGWAVGDKGVILQSSDGGSTWTPQTSGVADNLESVHFVDSLNGWAVGGTAVLKTTNGGITWSKVRSGSYHAVFFTSVSHGVIIGGVANADVTTDGGDHWTPFSLVMSGSAGIRDVQFITNQIGWAVGLSADLIQYTCDAWGSCYYTYRNPRTAVWKTVDGGQTWAEKRLTSTDEWLEAVDFLDQSHGWAVGTRGSIYYTTDGGGNWALQTSGLTTALRSVDFLDSQRGWAVGSAGILLETVDGGTTWAPNGPTQLVTYRGVQALDTQKVWVAGTSGTILHTADGGESWSKQTSGTTTSLSAIQFINALSGWVVGIAGTVLRSSDGGTTWNPVGDIPTDASLSSIHMVSEQNGWAAGGTIWHTTNGGTNWQSQFVPQHYLSSIFFVDSQHGWAVGGNSICRTANGGSNWSEQLLAESTNLRSVHFTDTSNGWAVGSSGLLLHTTDGGIHWEEMSGGGSYTMSSVRFVDPQLGWVLGSWAILRTTDGGTTWDDIKFPYTLNALSMANNQVGWAVGYDGVILKTTNGGVALGARIKVDPMSQTIQSGHSVTLNVAAVGVEPLTYQWYQGYSGDISNPIEGATSSSFTSPSLTSWANFWVRVSNQYSSSDSQTAYITVVADCLPVFNSQPYGSTIDPGQTTTLSISASGCTPLTYQWYEGSTGDTSHPVTGATTNLFTTPALTNTTTFWVRVSNASGHTDSSAAVVTVRCTVPYISNVTGATISPGQTATVTVVIGGNSCTPLTYQWYEGSYGDTSHPISGAVDSSYTTPPLTQSTRYWVRVSNSAGSADSWTAYVSVICTNPSITVQPQGTSVDPGGTAILTVEATGAAPLAYQWYEGNRGDTSKPIGGAVSAQFTTPAIQQPTSYWVRVSSPCGSTDSMAATITFNVVLLFFPQVANGTAGSMVYQTTVKLLSKASEVELGLEFYDSSGNAMQVDLGPSGKSSTFRLTLTKGESFSAQTTGTGPLQVGYACVRGAPGLTADLGGTAVFTLLQGGVKQFETGVPATSGTKDFTVLLDARGSARNTGIAFVNAGNGPATGKLRLYDKSFAFKAEKALEVLAPNFLPGRHLAAYATEIFPLIRQQKIEEGTITVESSQPLAALTLRQRDDFAVPFPSEVTSLTTFPVVEGRADKAGAATSSAQYEPGVANIAVSLLSDDLLRVRSDIERSDAFEQMKRRMDSAAPTSVNQSGYFEVAPDGDDDGMPDDWEVDQSLDPSDPSDAWLDPDGDQVVNLFEFQLGSDPHSDQSPEVATAGTATADYPDPQSALEAVPSGTVVRIAGGLFRVNYKEFTTARLMLQGGWDSGFTQRNLREFPTTLDGANEGEILYFSMSEGENAVILDGLRLVRGNGNFGAVNLLAQGSAIFRSSVKDSLITESTVKGGYGGVLAMFNWDTSQGDRTVVNSAIVGNAEGGINGYATATATARWRIINSSVASNGTEPASYSDAGLRLFTLDQGNLSIQVLNTILWGNVGNDVSVGSGITANVDYSDFGTTSTGTAAYTAGPHMISADPKMADAAGGDYHIGLDSPCLDSGLDSGLPPFDIEGDPRVAGPTPDIGADELYSSARYFPQIADGTAGALAFRSSLLFVNTGSAAEVQVDFFKSDGTPMPLALGNRPAAAQHIIALGRGESFSAETPGTGALKVGYVKWSASAAIGGTAVYSLSQGKTALSEAGVPATSSLSEFTLFADLSGILNTGLAIVNTGSEEAVVNFRLYDKNFSLVAETDLDTLRPAFGPGRHVALFVTEIFPQIGGTGFSQGTLTVHSSQPLAAVTVRQGDVPGQDFPLDVLQMTTFPVIRGTADDASGPAAIAPAENPGPAPRP